MNFLTPVCDPRVGEYTVTQLTPLLAWFYFHLRKGSLKMNTEYVKFRKNDA